MMNRLMAALVFQCPGRLLAAGSLGLFPLSDWWHQPTSFDEIWTTNRIIFVGVDHRPAQIRWRNEEFQTRELRQIGKLTGVLTFVRGSGIRTDRMVWVSTFTKERHDEKRLCRALGIFVPRANAFRVAHPQTPHFSINGFPLICKSEMACLGSDFPCYAMFVQKLFQLLITYHLAAASHLTIFPSIPNT